MSDINEYPPMPEDYNQLLSQYGFSSETDPDTGIPSMIKEMSMNRVVGSVNNQNIVVDLNRTIKIIYMGEAEVDDYRMHQFHILAKENTNNQPTTRQNYTVVYSGVIDGVEEMSSMLHRLQN